MEADYDKLAFGRTLQESGQHGFITSSICHNYGSVSGCDEGCPDLLEGDCEDPKEALKVCDIDSDEKKEIMEKYYDY